LDAPAAATAINDLVSQVKALKARVESGKNAKTAAPASMPHQDAKEPATMPRRRSPVSPHSRPHRGAVARLRDTLKAWYARYDGFNPRPRGGSSNHARGGQGA